MVVFCMLNPSTADHQTNDPTVRRCIGFAESWGYARLIVVNLFAARSTDPKALPTMADPVGPDNDEWIRKHAREADMIVAAWGNRGAYLGRDRKVLEILASARDVFALRITGQGSPEHPLYVPQDVEPVVFRRKAA